MAKPDVRSEDALLHTAFSLYSNPGAYALLLGAGVSFGSVATAWDVLVDLITRLARMRGEDPGEDVEKWYEATYGEKTSYPTILKALAPTSTERQALLRGYFERTDDEPEDAKRPNAAHRAVARLVKAGVVRIIMTTNFDRLIEHAIREVGIEPVIVASPAAAGNLTGLHTATCVVIHLHGDYLDPISMLNTPDELRDYNAKTRKLLGKVLDECGLLIAGWSATYDGALRRSVGNQATKLKRYTLNWIGPTKPSEAASELLALLNGVFVPATAAAAFGRMADCVEALQDRSSRHPLTVPVAIATAKRELAGSSAGIDLHDTVHAELNTLDRHPDFYLEQYQDPIPYGGIGPIWERIEEASKVPAALVATMAYWGSYRTDAWWVPGLERFATTITKGGTILYPFAHVRAVAGLALFYAGGVAAVAAERYDVLDAMFRVTRKMGYETVRETLADYFLPHVPYSGNRQRTYELITPLLQEVLTASPAAVDGYWEKFEVIRAAWVASTNPQFVPPAQDFAMTSQTLAHEATKKAQLGDKYHSTAVDVDELTRRRERLINDLARFPKQHPVHVLATTQGSKEARIPVAARLADEIEQRGAQHPITQLTDQPLVFAAALRAVSLSWGEQAEKTAWNSNGVLAFHTGDDVWWDTRESPEDVEARRTPTGPSA